MIRDSRQHLTVHEFIDLALEVNLENLAGAIEHLEHCVKCTQKLEDSYKAQEQFLASDWEPRPDYIESMRKQIFAPSVYEGVKYWFSNWWSKVKESTNSIEEPVFPKSSGLPKRLLTNLLTWLLSTVYVPVPTRLAVMFLLAAFVVTCGAAAKLGSTHDANEAKKIIASLKEEISRLNAEIERLKAQPTPSQPVETPPVVGVIKRPEEVVEIREKNAELERINKQLGKDLAKLKLENNRLMQALPPLVWQPSAPGFAHPFERVIKTWENISLNRGFEFPKEASWVDITIEIKDDQQFVDQTIRLIQGDRGAGLETSGVLISRNNRKATYRVNAGVLNGWHRLVLELQKPNGHGGFKPDHFQPVIRFEKQ